MTTTPAAGEADALPPQLAAAASLGAGFLAGNGSALDWARIGAMLAAAGDRVAGIREVLQGAQAALASRFLAGESATALVADRTRLIDQVIRAAWAQTGAQPLPDIVLAAVGGYGRGELHPCSDVDLLVLLPDHSATDVRPPVARFLALLWDLGLEVGHGTRTVADCRAESIRDLSTATTLMEARRLLGPEELFARMVAACAPPQVWPADRFFAAKLKEQQARHARYDDTAYNLEPDIKGSPGGLRDINMILWVACRHFGTGDPEALVSRHFLTPGQLALLRQGREFLWRLRFALHLLTGRKEDRLLFDHQARIARLFGYQDATYMLAVEQLMQRYYRTVMELSRLNEMLLQLFQEAILLDPDAAPEPLNGRFQLKNGFLQVAHPQVFERQPSAMLELFLLLQQNPQARGVSATTVDLLQRSLHLIDDGFRQDPRNHRLFLQILRASEGVTHGLRRMNLYGVLGRYIPAFGRIVGRMQYDLFHAYTVDAHTLFVVSNLRRFALARHDHEFPRCSEIMRGLPTPELIYLAGLFHDIAKGRGGDHSELGAVDAEAFCLEHGMSRYESRLVAWLVRHHLKLSMTAQRRDITDPEIISEFAAFVGDETHLDYLYLLTVADVRATNPKLWNSWKAQLFEELYLATRHALRRGLETPIDKEELLAGRQAAARSLLAAAGVGQADTDRVWAGLTEDYFLRCRPETIAWHTRELASFDAADQAVLVAVHEASASGGTEVFIYAVEERHTFALATAVLDELGFTIADARIIPLDNGHSISTYVVLEQTGERSTDLRRHAQIRRQLERAFARGDGRPARVTRRIPRQVRMFPTPTLVHFSTDGRNQRTIMELVAGDRPGLLSEVGKVLRSHDVLIHAAKIVTLGERAEDIFFITGHNGLPLGPASCDRLQQALVTALQRPA
ncbi:MAG: [protein-PII] uridylyltransferase [Gammaproteobacteria bacterium]|nr:[protein-PII] uridylyltransferase [Gammaproteobacteria bacterium]